MARTLTKKKRPTRVTQRKSAAKRVYLDYAAATPMRKEALAALVAYEKKHPENPSSIHRGGVFARRAIEEARQVFAEGLSAHADEIIFTSNATEANMTALTSAVEGFRAAFPGKTPEILISSIEHASVHEGALALVHAGKAIVREIPGDEYGTVSLKALRELITPNTAIVSVMYANNEFGTIEPVKDIVKVAVRARKENQLRYPLVHTDACQAAQFLDIASSRLNIDFLTISGAKFYGPKGVGVLYVRRGGSVTPVIPGEQEQGRRGGTEWGAGIVAAATAFALARRASAKEEKRLRKLSGALTADLIRRVPGVIINGHPTERVPHIVNFSVPGMAHDYLALALDAEGFAVSTGSACTGTLGADSRVILALKKQGVHGGIRVSLGSDTTAQSLKEFVSALGRILARMEPYADVSDI